MKQRFLLFLFAMLFGFGTANAQSFHKGIKSVYHSENLIQSLTKAECIETTTVLPAAAKSMQRRIDSTESFLSGEFVQVYKYSEHGTDIVYPKASVINMTSEVRNDTTWITLTGALDGASTVYGFYDNVDNTIKLKSGLFCQHHSDYGNFTFYAYKENGENIEHVDYYVLDVTTDKDGHISLKNANEQEAEGWYVCLTEGIYAGLAWADGMDLILNQPNATFEGLERHIQASSWTASWSTGEIKNLTSYDIIYQRVLSQSFPPISKVSS